jgi:hypothetical protein
MTTTTHPNQIELKEGNPSTGFHGYNPQDFYAVEETLRQHRQSCVNWSDRAHGLGIKIIQDEVAKPDGSLSSLG